MIEKQIDPAGREGPTRTLARLVMVVCGLVVLSLAALLPPRPASALQKLPPRPTPRAGAALPEGANIQLRVPAAPAGLWTCVQWQDGSGGWHDVEGWQGTLDEIVAGEGTKVWWVGQEHWGAGPFRWVLYQGQEGPSLAASEAFYLPSAANASVQVRVSAGQLPLEQGQGSGVGRLPQGGGERQPPTSHLIALLLALVGLLALLGTPLCRVARR